MNLRRLAAMVCFWALATWACSSARPPYTCADQDGDGFGVGLACQGPDCNDANADCHEGDCCLDCQDVDGDGYGSGDDCQGPDCNDSDADCHEGACCNDCLDYDGDGYGQGADCPGADCNDSDPTCHQGPCCDNCTDADGDGYGEGVDCLGSDCDDNDAGCYSGPCCQNCDDADGDGYGQGGGCSGPDCDDDNPDCHEGTCCLACSDADGDGYGDGPGCQGPDCNDADGSCHQGACCNPCPSGEEFCDGSCVDTQSDPAHCGGCNQACDATELCQGGSCSCPDADGDGYDVCAAGAAHDNDGLPADCDDDPATGAGINPGEQEVCGDGVDEDCSGDIDDLDEDADGHVAIQDQDGNACGGDDCDDDDAAVNPSAAESCNGVDDNCDGATDENTDQPCYEGPAGTEGEGICVGGTRYCVDGQLGACLGQVLPSAEACNDLDDDCDGRTDEDTVTLTCGLGECAVAVPSCDNGVPQVCRPGSPGNEVCDGLDNDCDGVTDETCNCVYVAPFGNDADTGGTTDPLRTINAAIALAANDANRNQVCVAGVPGCASSGTWAFYREDVVMVDGISVLGGFNPGNWQQMPLHVQNPHCVTEIQGGSAPGLVFPPEVTNPTALDNFVVSQQGSDLDNAALSVWGSTGAVISNCTVIGNRTGRYTAGIAVGPDGDGNPATPLIANTTVEGGAGTTSIGIYSSNSRPTIQASCSPGNIDPASGRCFRGCIDGIHIRGNRFFGSGQPIPDYSYGVLLENSPGAFIDQSTICASGLQLANAVAITGDATGVAVVRSDLVVWGADIDSALAAADCGGAAPWIADNERLGAEGNAAGNATVAAVYAAGDCHPLIENNQLIVGGIEGQTNETRGVVCDRSNVSGTSSRCSIVNNVEIRGSNTNFPASAIGVLCADGACNLIRGNQLIHGNSGVDVIGLLLRGPGNAVVDGNHIRGGCGNNSATAVLSENSSARLQNNSLVAGTCQSGIASQADFFGIMVRLNQSGNELDIHSNLIDGAGLNLHGCSSRAVAFDRQFGAPPTVPPSGILRNNILVAGLCQGANFAVQELDAGADPRLVENNDLLWPAQAVALYLDEAQTPLDINGVNSLADIQAAGGNIDLDPLWTPLGNGFYHIGGNSPCLDAGTPAGAPAWDFEGDPRLGNPDIGPDEVVP